MSQKEFAFEEAARKKLLEGILAFVDVLTPTFGPKGLSIAIDSPYGPPKLSAHGKEIIPSIELKDPHASIGALLAKDMSSKVEKTCGDGTTLATILLGAFVKEGMKLLSSGENPLHIKKGLEKASLFVADFLEKKASPLHKESDLKKMTLMACNHEENLANLLYKAIEQVGKEGTLCIKEGKRADTTLEKGEGIILDRGYASAYFCTDTQKQIVEMEEVKILITSEKLSSIHAILPLLQLISSTSTNLLIIAEDFEADLLSTLAVNKLKGILKIAAIKAPGFGPLKQALLEDIALLTGAVLIAEKQGFSLNTCGLEVLGIAKKVTITKERTTVEMAKERSSAVKERLLSIEKQLKGMTSPHERKQLEKRKEVLSAQMAFLHVGALTEIELKRKKTLLENALTSIHASLEKGTVIGGGISLLHASVSLDPLAFTPQERPGAILLKKGLEAPFRQLIKNAGYEPSLYVDKVLNLQNENMGFNVLTLEIEDFSKEGIIDPVKVILSALNSAISTTLVALLSEVLIADSYAKEENVQP